MQRHHRRVRIWEALAIVVALMAVWATPAFAQGGGGKFVLGEDYILNANETLDGGLVVVGGSAAVKKGARVNGDVFVGGGNVTISGVVHGSVAAWGGNVRLTRTAEVTGDVVTLGGEVLRDEGSQVGGDVTSNTSRLDYLRLPHVWGAFSAGGWRNALSGVWGSARWAFNSFITALALAVLAALVVLVFEKPARQMQETMAHVPWASLGMGALTIVTALAVTVVLTITLCLIPLAILLVMALMIAILAGWAVVSLWGGERILLALKANTFSPWMATALGALVLALLSRLPGIGWLIGIVAASAGLGALVLTRAGSTPYPRPAVAPSSPAPPAPPHTPASVEGMPAERPAAALPQEGQGPDQPAA